MNARSKPLSARIAELRELLRSSTDLAVPWDYFHDEVTVHAGFGHLGKVTLGLGEPLDRALEAIGTKLFGDATAVEHLMTVRVPEHGLRHGLSSFGGRPLIYFHFEGIDQGLAGIWNHPGEPASETVLVRFSFLELAPGATTISNRRGAA
jgi:hypothetical protein